MNITELSIKNPYLVVSLSIAIAVLGLISFLKTPVDLFPDTTPPQVLVITVEPGASAKDVSDKITEIIEKEVNTISGIKRVRATSRDEVSAVLTEFFYSKDINEAVTDVVNAIERIKAQLPLDTRPSQIYRIGDATHATMTIALSPKPETGKSLETVRLLAENDIRDDFLRLKAVGDVDVFGGYKPEVGIEVDRDKLRGYHLTLMDVIAAVSKRNVTIPGGYIYGTKKEYLVRTDAEFKGLEEIKDLPIKENSGKTGFIFLKDVATVRQGVEERRSLYHGNGRPAIALNILRPDKGHTLETIQAAKKLLPELERRYPDIRFEITDDQEPIVDVNLKGMRSSLVQAVILTVLIIFLFLADKKAAAIISVSIPMAFLFSLMVLKFSPYTMNMVTLSGLIIAVGMVVDASIVVLENIFRHFTGNRDLSGREAALIGTKEVALANTAGMLTTVIVLFPVMFTGGYPQQVLRQLSIIIGSTIFASLIASLTIVPLIASRILMREERKKNVFERMAEGIDGWVKKTSAVYVFLLKGALKHRRATIMVTMASFMLTMRIVAPLLVGELMPPMDTGIVKVTLDMPSQDNIREVEKIVSRVEDMIRGTEGYVSLSTVIGSEPGQTSFGQGGATVQQAFLTAHLVTRDKRKTTIWEIEDRWRDAIRKIPGIRSFTVVEFGATPISTTKAPFDFIIRGKNPEVLDKMADRALAKLKGTRGLVDIRRSWYKDKPEVEITPDPAKCRYYGVSTKEVAEYIKFAVKGAPVSRMRLEGFLDIPIRVAYRDQDLDTARSIDAVYIPTRYGQIPMRNFVDIKERRIQPFITREDLENTIDITGVNSVATIAQAASAAGRHLRRGGMILPDGYSVRMSGTPENMMESKRRLGKSLLFGIILLYLLIVPMYKSFTHPLVIMSAIPLAVIGAFWGLLIFDKPMCMPAFMGMILLAGTIVNNSILLLDFILQARAKGVPRDEAIIQSVAIRTRPILMTACSTVIGLTPLVFEMAVGLERLSPLGIVAACGLILGTFLTMIVIPVIYSLIDDLKEHLSRRKAMPKASHAAGGLLIGVGLLVAAPRVLADTATSPIPTEASAARFDLRKAVAYALEHSPDIDESKAAVLSSRGGRQRALSGLLPRLTALGSYTEYRLDHPIISGVAGEKQRFDDRVATGKIEGNLLVTDFGKTYYAYESAKDAYLASVMSLERKKEVVIYTVADVYFEIDAVKSLLKAFRAQHRSLEELKKRMELFLKDGKIAKIDLLKVDVRLAAIEDKIEQLKSRQVFLTARLAEEIGWEGPLELDDAFRKVTSDVTGGMPLDTHLKDALETRRDIRAARRLSQSEKARWTSSRRAFFPRILLTGGVGEFSGFSEAAKFEGDKRWDDDMWVGLSVSLPLFDGGLRHGDELAAEGGYHRTLAREKKVRLDVYKDIQKAWADMRSARKRMALAEESRKQAEETLRLERLKYKDGKGVINDVLDAEASVRAADALFFEALADYNISIFEFSLARGDLLEHYEGLISSVGETEPEASMIKKGGGGK